ncbi:Protein of unknown function DUF1468 [Rhabdaerophilaceae bacterium]
MSATLSRKAAEFFAGFSIAAVGGWFARAATLLPPSDEPGVPGAGTMPLILGILVMLCGFAIVLAGVIRTSKAEIELGGSKHAIALVSLFCALILFEPAGFMLTTFLFLACGFVLLGDAHWSKGIPAAGVASALLWILFAKLLGVGLPYGVIGEILFR